MSTINLNNFKANHNLNDSILHVNNDVSEDNKPFSSHIADGDHNIYGFRHQYFGGVGDSISYPDDVANFNFRNDTLHFPLDWYGNCGFVAGIQPCVVKDNKVQYYLDPFNYDKKSDGTPSDLTGADGNVMVRFPKVYTRTSISMVNGIHFREILFSQYPHGEHWHCHPAFLKEDGSEASAFYVSMFFTSMYRGNPSSISTGEFNYNIAPLIHWNAVKGAYGTNWSGLTFDKIMYITDLLCMITKSTNFYPFFDCHKNYSNSNNLQNHPGSNSFTCGPTTIFTGKGSHDDVRTFNKVFHIINFVNYKNTFLEGFSWFYNGNSGDYVNVSVQPRGTFSPNGVLNSPNFPWFSNEHQLPLSGSYPNYNFRVINGLKGACGHVYPYSYMDIGGNYISSYTFNNNYMYLNFIMPTYIPKPLTSDKYIATFGLDINGIKNNSGTITSGGADWSTPFSFNITNDSNYTWVAPAKCTYRLCYTGD